MSYMRANHAKCSRIEVPESCKTKEGPEDTCSDVDRLSFGELGTGGRCTCLQLAGPGVDLLVYEGREGNQTQLHLRQLTVS